MSTCWNPQFSHTGKFCRVNFVKFLIFFPIFLFSIFSAKADTETINWYMDGSVYDTTTCTVGGDVNLPSAPTKNGYTFRGWLDGYTLLQYATSNGGYINTGIAPEPTNSIRVIVRVSGNISGGLFGAYYVNKNFYTKYQTSDGYLYDYYGASYANKERRTCAISSGIMDQGIIIDKNGRVTTVYDVYGKKLCNMTTFYSDGSFGRAICFPGINWEDRGIDSKGNYTFYFFKIYENGALIRDYIPVKRNSDNVVGMYDIIQNEFVNPSGGSFTAGPAL